MQALLAIITDMQSRLGKGLHNLRRAANLYEGTGGGEGKGHLELMNDNVKSVDKGRHSCSHRSFQLQCTHTQHSDRGHDICTAR